MNDREHRSDHQSEDGDDLGTPRHRPPPARIHESQDCRDQRSRVADADPKYEICYVKRPKDGPTDSRYREAIHT